MQGSLLYYYHNVNYHELSIGIIHGFCHVTNCHSLPYELKSRDNRKTVISGFNFYAPERGKHIVAALSVHPVPCPSNNFKTTGGI